MDSGLAGINVQELTQRLKMFMPQTPVLVFVASTEDDPDLQALARTANKLLTKP